MSEFNISLQPYESPRRRGFTTDHVPPLKGAVVIYMEIGRYDKQQHPKTVVELSMPAAAEVALQGPYLKVPHEVFPEPPDLQVDGQVENAVREGIDAMRASKII